MLNRFADGDSAAEEPVIQNFSVPEWHMALIGLVGWWSGLQKEIEDLWHPRPRQDQPLAVPGLDEAEAAMRDARIALAAVITDTSEDDNPLPAFLRHYRLWTRSICEMGRKGWPGIDWSDLERVV
jgi:hypothetical protein